MKYAEEHPAPSNVKLLGNTSSYQRWYVGDDIVAHYYVIRSIYQSQGGNKYFVSIQGAISAPYTEYKDGYVTINNCTTNWGYTDDNGHSNGCSIVYNVDVYVVTK